MNDSTLALNETSDIGAFLRNPLGSYLRRPGFLYWYPWLGCTGFAVFGRPAVAELRELHRVMDVVLSIGSDIHTSLVDMSRLESIDDEAFSTMATYLLKRRHSFAKLIRRQALVRPGGVVGAVVAGFHRVVPALHPTEVFENLVEAVASLDIPCPTRFSKSLADLYPDRPEDSDIVVTRLRQHLCRHLAETSVELAAKALCVSVRTLQRRLARCGTSFKSEMNAAQVRLAKRFILSGDVSLTEVAYRVQCSSLQHFSAMFRRLTGETPSVWRDRQLTSGGSQYGAEIEANGANVTAVSTAA
jgi:AraC-like DNA-binding protein